MKKYTWLLALTAILIMGCTPAEPIPTVDEVLVNKWKVNTTSTTNYMRHYDNSGGCHSPDTYDTTSTTVTNDGLYEFKADQTGYRLSSTAVQYDFNWIYSAGVIIINYTGSSPDEQVTPTVTSSTKMTWNFAPIVSTGGNGPFMCPNDWQEYYYLTETTAVKVASVEKM